MGPNQINQDNLTSLMRLLRRAVKANRFSLILALYDVPHNLLEYLKEFERQCHKRHIMLYTVDLWKSRIDNLRSLMQTELYQHFPEGFPPDLAIQVTGLELSILIDPDERAPAVLQTLNIGRDSYRKLFPCPLVFWLPEYAWIKLADVAPDFWSVREGSFVFLTGETHEAFTLQEETDKILTRQEAQQVTFWQDKITQISTIEGILQSSFVGQMPLEAFVELQLKLGEAYRTVEHYERAQQCFEQALQINRETLHDPEREGSALNGLGLIYTDSGHFAKAEDCFNRFLSLRQQQGEDKALAVGYNHLGGVFDKRGESEQAIAYFQKALEISRGVGQPLLEAEVLGNLGLVYRKQRHFDQALQAHQQALIVSRRYRHVQDEAKDLNNIGLVYYEQKDYRKAIVAYKDAVEISRRFDYKLDALKYQLNLGDAYRQTQEFERAKACYQEIQQDAEKLGHEEYLLSALLRLADLYSPQYLNDETQELARIEQVIKQLKKARNPGNILTSVKRLIALCQHDITEYQRCVQLLKIEPIVKRLLQAEEASLIEVYKLLATIYHLTDRATQAQEYHRKLAESGYRQLTIWLDPETAEIENNQPLLPMGQPSMFLIQISSEIPEHAWIYWHGFLDLETQMPDQANREGFKVSVEKQEARRGEGEGDHAPQTAPKKKSDISLVRETSFSPEADGTSAILHTEPTEIFRAKEMPAPAETREVIAPDIASEPAELVTFSFQGEQFLFDPLTKTLALPAFQDSEVIYFMVHPQQEGEGQVRVTVATKMDNVQDHFEIPLRAVPLKDLPGGQEMSDLQEAYLNRLLETCGQVFLSGIDKKAAGQGVDTSLQLSAIYTALLTLSVEREHVPSRKGSKAVSFPSSEEAGMSRLSAVQQVNSHKRLVLLGDPGSGKSTFINFVTLCLAGELLHDPSANLACLTAPLPTEKEEEKEKPQPWDHGALVPVRIILRDFAARGLPSVHQAATAKHLWQFLTQELEDHALERYTPYLRKYLRIHGGVVLFDGLDEVPEAEQRRTQIKQVVESFARAFPQCRIVITSRTYAYQQQEWRLSGFTEAVLATFTQEQIQQFINRWYRHSAEIRGMNLENARGQAELLKQAILKSNRLYSLAERPLLLTLMASLHYWRGGSLPEKREELYNDTVDLLLDWWERPKVVRGVDGQVIIAQSSLTELLNVGKDLVRNVLNYLAFQAHSSQPDLIGTADITEQTLKTELMNISQNPDLRPHRLLEYLSNRAGLLVPRGVGVYTFPHRTFQEYLAACYLADQDDYPENVAELARQEPNRWREVLLLAGARASRGAAASIWGLADALCYREVEHKDMATEDAWGALLAGQALAETANLEQISPRNQAKADRVRDWLVAILTEHKPSGSPLPVVERATAGNILALLGDSRPGVGLQEDGLPDIEWCEVPEGTFLMGSDPKKDTEAYDDEQPQHEVHVSAFQISRYPVTNAKYQAFVEDGGYTKKWHKCWTQDGWKWKEKEQLDKPEKYGGLFDLANHPVVLVSWYEASAFCQWLTLRLREKGELAEKQIIRLPSEAEWEKAARGEDERIYPWGKSITPELANYDDTGLGATSAVGCFPRGISPYGCEEMAGNVWEWCQDLWHDNYKNAPEDGSAWLSSGGQIRVDRGGSWDYSARFVRCACRDDIWPVSRYHNLGFRLARIYQ